MSDLTAVLNWLLNACLTVWNGFVMQPNPICYFVLTAFFVRRAVKAFRKIY